MSGFKLELDAEEIAKTFGDLKEEVEATLHEAVRAASVMAYGMVQEEAAQRLKSRLKPYQEALSYMEVIPGVWSVSLDESAFWIEEGMEAHSQYDTLLKGNAKVSAEGFRYKVIPFEHSKNPSQQTNNARMITTMVKKELKSRGIPFKKIETDAAGSPRVGKLHSFSVPGSPKPSEKAKFGALMGVNIYQHKVDGKMRRDIMTYRVISEKNRGDGRWEHPGLEAEKILDDVFDKIQRIFDEQILPEVLQKFSHNE